MLLSRTDGAVVKAAAEQMGTPLRYAATTDDVRRLLARCYDEALAGAAIAGSREEKDAYWRAAISAKMALKPTN